MRIRSKLRDKASAPNLKPPRSVGSDYESLAQRYLEKRGLRTVAKNYRAPFGEIDLVMLDKGTLVFVEVRYRSHAMFGGALHSLHHAKRRRIVRSAQHYLMQHDHTGAVRFDFVAIESRREPIWIRDVFQEEANDF